MEFLIFRHGETDWNREERIQGHIDIPLNATGRAQARELIEPLREKRIEVIVSSDLKRAFEMADIIARELKLTIIPDARLREANLGAVQGLTRTEIETRFGRHTNAARMSDADVFYPNQEYPGSESADCVTRRAFQALEGFAENSDFHRVGVATHGGVIRRIMAKLLGPEAPPVPIPNGIIYSLTFDPALKRWSGYSNR